MTTEAVMEMTTAPGGEGVWRRRQLTASAVNGEDIDGGGSQWGWQSMGVAADRGGVYGGREWGGRIIIW
jgi:hypothetical protein